MDLTQFKYMWHAKPSSGIAVSRVTTKKCDVAYSNCNCNRERPDLTWLEVDPFEVGHIALTRCLERYNTVHSVVANHRVRRHYLVSAFTPCTPCIACMLYAGMVFLDLKAGLFSFDGEGFI
jgi:hypothetical protein